MPKQEHDPDRLAALVGELAVRETDQRWILDCPKCGGSEKLTVYKRSGYFRCFVCWGERGGDGGFSGAPEFAIAAATGRSVKAVRADLYGIGHVARGGDISLDWGDSVEDEVVVEEDEPAEVAWPVDCYPIEDRRARRGAEYLGRRGLPLELLARYGVRYSPARRSVAFPCYVAGKLLGWQWRIIDPERETLSDGRVVKRIKAMTESIPRDRVVMFADRLVGSDTGVLCEGPVDALKADPIGGNVATMGKSYSPAQLGIIVRSGISRLYVAFDPDAAPMLRKIARECAGAVETLVLKVPQPPGKARKKRDLGDVPLGDVPELFQRAEPLSPADLHLYWGD